MECLEHSYFESQQREAHSSSLVSSGTSLSSLSSSSSSLTVTRNSSNSREAVHYHTPELIHLHKTTLRQYSFLRSLEPTRDVLPDNTVLLNDSEWNFALREAMAAWIIEITCAFDPVTICQRTAFFAVALLDAYYARCLNPRPVVSSCSRRKPSTTCTSSTSSSVMTCAMDLVGPCCMHIASKCEDVFFIGIRDVASSLPNEYEPAEFLLVEEEVLNVLQFDLYIPTVVDFLGYYLECIPELFNAPPEIHNLCQYLSMSTLLTIDFNAFEPSRTATAIVSYALSYKADGTKEKDEQAVWVS